MSILSAYRIITTGRCEAFRFTCEGVFMDSKNDNSWSTIATMNPTELISWCKARKEALGLSNSKLAQLTSVPEGTIDRVFSGRYTEFKYSTIQPILVVLTGYNKETPEPDDSDDEQGKYYYDTIEGYKLVVDNKNHQIAELKNMCEKLQKELEFLKAENEHKKQTIQNMHEHIQWIERTIDNMKK